MAKHSEAKGAENTQRGADKKRPADGAQRRSGEPGQKRGSTDARSKGQESDLQEKVLYINRCSKVVKGGRKFSFSALILVGNRKDRVGCGFAKAKELTEAIRKAGECARKSVKRVVKQGTTVPHEVLVKWDGAQLLLCPAPDGAGVIAGSQVRAVLEMAGYENVMAKSLGASNPINLVRATFAALDKLQTREQILQSRGKA